MERLTEQKGRTPSALAWQPGTLERVTRETPSVKTFTFRLPEWRPFRPGQHYDVRLTAPDGYQAQRSYSATSAPECVGSVDLAIERFMDGEVSVYFHDVARPGDTVDLRGPIGGPFTWTCDMGGPLLLIAGGSGVAPLMSMLRHRAASCPEVPALLLYSARSLEEVIFRRELDRMAAEDERLVFWQTLTRRQPQGWTGFGRRIDQQMLSVAVARLGGVGRAYVCGNESFVEDVADALVAIGTPPEIIRTERFGSTA